MPAERAGIAALLELRPDPVFAAEDVQVLDRKPREMAIPGDRRGEFIAVLQPNLTLPEGTNYWDRTIAEANAAGSSRR